MNEYHLTIYQFSVLVDIEDRLKLLATDNDITDKLKLVQFRKNFDVRTSNQTKVYSDWKDNYSKLMARAYKGVLKDVGGI